MRNVSKLLTIGVMALALAACGKKGKGTDTPGAGGGPGAGTIDKPSAEARAEFDEVVAAYKEAVPAGETPSEGDCKKFVGKFEKLYQEFGEQMTVAEFNAATLLEACGDEKAAEKKYEQLANKSKYQLAMNNLGAMYWRRGETKKALEWFDKAVKADPKKAFAARNNLAAAHRDRYKEELDAKDFDEALKQIQNVLAVDTSNKMAYENLARLYYDRGRLKDKSYLLLSNLVVTQALQVLKKEGNDSAEIRNLKGLLLMEENNQVDALKSFKKAVELEPKHSDANLNIAFISIRFRDYATAEKSLEIALKDPKVQQNIEAWIALGVAQRGNKKYDAAEKTYKKAAEMAKDDPRPWFNLAVLYQDHKISEDGVDQAKLEEYYKVAQEHLNKTCNVVASKPCEKVDTKTLAKRQKKGRKVGEDERLVAEAKLRDLTIKEAFDAFAQAAELEKKMKELQKKEEEAAKKERERLLELEKQAAAEAAAAESAAAEGGDDAKKEGEGDK